MTISPVASLLALTLLAACPSRNVNPDVGIPDDAGDLATRRETAPAAFAVYSGFSDSTRVAVRTMSQWREVWARIAGNASPAPDAPEIDFATEMVLVAAMGTKPTGGWSVRIDRVARRGNTVWAEVTSQQPGTGCVSIAALTAPVDVVIVQRTDGKVVFVEKSEVRNC